MGSSDINARRYLRHTTVGSGRGRRKSMLTTRLFTTALWSAPADHGHGALVPVARNSKPGEHRPGA